MKFLKNLFLLLKLTRFRFEIEEIDDLDNEFENLENFSEDIPDIPISSQKKLPARKK